MNLSKIRFPTLMALCVLSFAMAANASINVSVTVGGVGCESAGDVCPAPQALFFDATATSCSAGECGAATSPTNSFRTLHYTWDFGDSGKGSWATGAAAVDGGHDKNTGYGPIAFHVYESAGTHTGSVTVTDGTSTVVEYFTVIVDEADTHFSSTTRCISRTATNWTGCPAGATQITDNVSSWNALVNAGIAAGDRRILFQGGGVYSSGQAAGVGGIGPVQLGTFGTAGVGGDARVTVNVHSGTTVLDGPSVAIERWSVFNFDFVWPGFAQNQALVRGDGFFFNTKPCWNDFLSFKNSAVNTVAFIHTLSCNPLVNPSGMSLDFFVVNDGESINGVGVNHYPCMMFNAQRGVVAGINWGSGCEREVRVTHEANTMGVSGPFILSHNTSAPTTFKTGESHFDLRGTEGDPDAGTGGARYVLVADNHFRTPGRYIETRCACAGACVVAQRQSDVMIERNRLLADIGYGFIANASARRLTLRNNVVQAGGGNGELYKTNPALAGCDANWARDNSIVHNSIYSNVNVAPISIGNGSVTDSGSVCKNNVYYNSVSGATSACPTASARSNNASLNVADDVVLTANPFVGIPAVSAPIGYWELNGSAGGGLDAIDGGSWLQEALVDALARSRPSGSAHDMGALEIQAGPASTPPLPPTLLD